MDEKTWDGLQRIMAEKFARSQGDGKVKKMDLIRGTITEFMGRGGSRAPLSGEEKEAFESDLESQEKKRVLDVVRCFGIPRRVQDNLKALGSSKCLESVRAWETREEKEWCLVLSAVPGAGKSTAAGYWLSGQVGELRPGPGIFRRWFSSVELNAVDPWSDEFGKICSAANLVLDDLGVEFGDQRGSMQSKLDRIFDARYRDYRRTLVTTNLAAKEFRERYGERLFDRLREGGTWESIKAQSMRGSR